MQLLGRSEKKRTATFCLCYIQRLDHPALWEKNSKKRPLVVFPLPSSSNIKKLIQMSGGGAIGRCNDSSNFDDINKKTNRITLKSPSFVLECLNDEETLKATKPPDPHQGDESLGLCCVPVDVAEADPPSGDKPSLFYRLVRVPSGGCFICCREPGKHVDLDRFFGEEADEEEDGGAGAFTIHDLIIFAVLRLHAALHFFNAEVRYRRSQAHPSQASFTIDYDHPSTFPAKHKLTHLQTCYLKLLNSHLPSRASTFMAKMSPTPPLPLPSAPLTLSSLYSTIHPSELPGLPAPPRGSSSLVMLHSEQGTMLVDVFYPFLSARDISSLSRTCKFLQNYRVYCPPMKLRLYPHQEASLLWMKAREENVRQSIRGGILADDPGLGKTISVITLVLTTLGMMSATPGVPSSLLQGVNASPLDSTLFKVYYAEGTKGYPRRMELRNIVTNIEIYTRKSFGSFIDFYVSPLFLPEYESVVHSPMWLKKVLDNNERDMYSETHEDFVVSVPQFLHLILFFLEFVSCCCCRRLSVMRFVLSDAPPILLLPLQNFTNDIYRIFSNASLYSPNCTEIVNACEASKEFAVKQFQKFAEVTMKEARRHAEPHNNPTSYKIVSELKKYEKVKSLQQSRTTLIVVPSQLLQHWEGQILSHVDFEYVANSPRGAADSELDGGGDGVHVEALREEKNGGCHIVRWRRGSPGKNNALVHPTDRNFLFMDYDRTTELPDASVIAKFDFFITSVERMTFEWKKGKGDHNPNQLDRFGFEYLPSKPSSLLKVNFVRMVVDEGHSMGKASVSNSIMFASWINSGHRWIMSGTPTPNSSGTTNTTATNQAVQEVNTIFGLLQFLKHPLYLPENGGRNIFSKLFTRGWRKGSLESFYELKALLIDIMIRHTKKNVANLPRPIFKVNLLPMSPAERLAYNTITGGVRMNLVTTSMVGAKVSAWADSLLNPVNYKYANEMMNNIRLACCGSRRVVPTLSAENFNLTVDILRAEHGRTDSEIQLAKNFMNRCTMEQTTSCQVCSQDFQCLALTPCCHFICPDCIEKTPKVCGRCNSPYDVDDFQSLQPGFDFHWVDNLAAAEDELRQRKLMAENLRLSSAINEMSSNVVVANAQHPPGNDAGNVHSVVEGADAVQTAAPSVMPRAPVYRRHKCQYSKLHNDGRCTLCFHIHEDCQMTAEHPCPECHKTSEECPTEETKVSRALDVLKFHFSRAFLRGSDVVCVYFGFRRLFTSAARWPNLKRSTRKRSRLPFLPQGAFYQRATSALRPSRISRFLSFPNSRQSWAS